MLLGKRMPYIHFIETDGKIVGLPLLMVRLPAATYKFIILLYYILSLVYWIIV
jgi:hypothetical protein